MSFSNSGWLVPYLWKTKGFLLYSVEGRNTESPFCSDDGRVLYYKMLLLIILNTKFMTSTISAGNVWTQRASWCIVQWNVRISFALKNCCCPFIFFCHTSGSISCYWNYFIWINLIVFKVFLQGIRYIFPLVRPESGSNPRSSSFEPREDIYMTKKGNLAHVFCRKTHL